MKIEQDSRGGKTTLRLMGRFQAEHIGELEKQLRSNGPKFVLDLREVTVVDVDIVRFLSLCEARGARIVRCSQYIREWINRERQEWMM